MFEKRISINDLNPTQIGNLIGIYDKNLKTLSKLYDCHISFHNDELILMSEKEIDNYKLEHLQAIINLIKTNNNIDYNTIKQSYIDIMDDKDLNYLNETIAYTFSGKPIRPKTFNQHALLKSIKNNDVIFSIGPAGTGKTFLAILLAVQAYKNNDVKKIILSRPAVEAGESLGFLPGDLKEKVDPYLMPLYDSLNELLGSEQVERLVEKGDIEIIPLAYMRGRTLNDAFILLDEAQNTTNSQMLMFLTRLGYNSKMIINGDITQIDLNLKLHKSGLVEAIKKLTNIDKIDIIEFSNNDIVRNELVQKIIERYGV